MAVHLEYLGRSATKVRWVCGEGPERTFAAAFAQDGPSGNRLSLLRFGGEPPSFVPIIDTLAVCDGLITDVSRVVHAPNGSAHLVIGTARGSATAMLSTDGSSLVPTWSVPPLFALGVSSVAVHPYGPSLSSLCRGFGGSSADSIDRFVRPATTYLFDA